MQGQDPLVQHPNQVVLLAHDAGHHVMLCQVSYYTKPGCVLDLQHVQTRMKTAVQYARTNDRLTVSG